MVSQMDLEGAADGVVATLVDSEHGLVAGGGLDDEVALVAIGPQLGVRWIERYGEAAPWLGRYSWTTAAPDGGYTFSAVPQDEDGTRIAVKTDSRGRTEARGRIDVGSSAAESPVAQLAGGGYVVGWTERAPPDGELRPGDRRPGGRRRLAAGVRRPAVRPRTDRPDPSGRVPPNRWRPRNRSVDRPTRGRRYRDVAVHRRRAHRRSSPPDERRVRDGHGDVRSRYRDRLPDPNARPRSD